MPNGSNEPIGKVRICSKRIGCGRGFACLAIAVHVQQVAVIAAGLQMNCALAFVRSRLREHHFLDEPAEKVQVIHRQIRFVTSAWPGSFRAERMRNSSNNNKLLTNHLRCS